MFRMMLACALLSCLIWPGTAAIHASESRRPNIIYVMLDDAGYGDFGCYGSEHVLTPHIDRMAAEGMRFTDHYAGAAVCAPTRSVLMTGLHTGHTRRRDNQAVAHRDELTRGLVFLQPEDVTVAKMLQQAGYVTGGIGKWGLGNPGSTGVPEKQGFDHWFGFLDQVHAHNHYAAELWRNGEMIEVPENRGRSNRQVYVHDLLEQDTLAFIREHGDQPFFLYLAYTLPHGRFVIPENDPACEPYRDRPWPEAVRNYAAMITRADRTIGLVLELLQELQIDEHTIVFVTSDNGPPGRQFVQHLNSSGPLRGIKRDLYEGGIRAPMVVRGPGIVPANVTSDFVWWMADVFPTLCELAGVAVPEGLDGVSVVPTLKGESQQPHQVLYWERHQPGFKQAVRMGPWKGVRFGTAEPLELYNLNEDIGERHNVAATYPQIVQKMEAYLRTARTESRYWPTRESRGE